MKKLVKLLLSLLMLLSLFACTSNTNDGDVKNNEVSAENDYEDFKLAKVDDQVELLISVQACEKWNDEKGQGRVTVYGQDDDSGYYIYDMFSDENTANAMVPGTLIKVIGYKSDWPSESAIVDATAEIIVGEYDGKVYDAKDVTDLCGDQTALKQLINQKVSFKALEVIDYHYGDANVDKSSREDSDLYLNLVCPNDARMVFVVNRRLFDSDSELYKFVETLQTGDLVDIEAFMNFSKYPRPHILTIKKSEIVQ